MDSDTTGFAQPFTRGVSVVFATFQSLNRASAGYGQRLHEREVIPTRSFFKREPHSRSQQKYVVLCLLCRRRSPIIVLEMVYLEGASRGRREGGGRGESSRSCTRRGDSCDGGSHCPAPSSFKEKKDLEEGEVELLGAFGDVHVVEGEAILAQIHILRVELLKRL